MHVLVNPPSMLLQLSETRSTANIHHIYTPDSIRIPLPNPFFSITPSIILLPLTNPVVQITILLLCPSLSNCPPTNLNAAISACVTPPKNITNTHFTPPDPTSATLVLAALSSVGFWVIVKVGPLADFRMSSKPDQPVLDGVRGRGERGRRDCRWDFWRMVWIMRMLSGA